jgi:asparagine synthase (glutamine-hydrolysing)
MCGIAGIWQRDGGKVRAETIKRFIEALTHRGPDGQGIILADQGSMALAHRRLAIFDVSCAGSQPMRSASGRFDITYNGAIYNFLELREELKQHGYRFRTNTDTEVILAAYEWWGADCLSRFNGMWSFVIWDRQLRHLFAARDRFGIKPLYVLFSGQCFAFASELKAFLNLDGYHPRANIKALQARLRSNFSELCLLEGVSSVPPGHYLTVRINDVQYHRWWNTLDHLVTVPSDFRKQAEEFRGLLFDACKLRERCDVPLATALSGGLDSSSILSVRTQSRLAGEEHNIRLASDWRRAFIASFPGTPQDETVRALEIAKRSGVTPVVRTFNGSRFRSEIHSYLYQFEEIGGIFGGAAWALYREMRREHVAVSLDGLGADELLGGYTRHVILALSRAGSLLRNPQKTLSLINTLRHMQSSDQRASLLNSALLAALTISPLRSVAARHPLAQHLATLAHSVRDPTDPAAENAIDALGPLTSALYRGFHTLTLPRVLRNFDVHSMGHGIELRMPFLDWRLVAYAFSTPDESKLGQGYSKRLLREAMSGLLPDDIRLRREKLGFNVPITSWLGREGLGDWLWDMVNERDFLDNDLWNGQTLLALTRSKRLAGASWTFAEANTVLLAVSAHWWISRWLQASTT